MRDTWHVPYTAAAAAAAAEGRTWISRWWTLADKYSNITAKYWLLPGNMSA